MVPIADLLDYLVNGDNGNINSVENSHSPGSSTPPHVPSPSSPQGPDPDLFFNISPNVDHQPFTQGTNIATPMANTFIQEPIGLSNPADCPADTTYQQPFNPTSTKRRRLNEMGSYAQPVTPSSREYSEECHDELDHDNVDKDFFEDPTADALFGTNETNALAGNNLHNGEIVGPQNTRNPYCLTHQASQLATSDLEIVSSHQPSSNGHQPETTTLVFNENSTPSSFHPAVQAPVGQLVHAPFRRNAMTFAPYSAVQDPLSDPLHTALMQNGIHEASAENLAEYSSNEITANATGLEENNSPPRTVLPQHTFDTDIDDLLAKFQSSAENNVHPDPAWQNEPLKLLEEVWAICDASEREEEMGYDTIEIENPQECEECNQMFIDEDALGNHKKRCHDRTETTDLKQCPICLVRFKAEHVERHVLTVHRKDASVKCEHCETIFSSKKSLSLHRREIHGQDPPSAVKKRASRNRANKKKTRKNLLVYKCTTDCACNYQTTSRALIRRHIDMTHKNLRPFECQFCGYRSKTREHKLIHEATHTPGGSSKRKRGRSFKN